MKYLVLLLISLISCSAFGQSRSSSESLVLRAANQSIQSFTARIPEGSEQDFGYANREEIKRSKVGKPIRVLILSKDFYTAKSLSGDNYIQESNEWRVPVTVAGSNRNLLTVNGKDKKYKAEDIGGAGLAKELGKVAATIPKGSNCYILRVYQLTADFLVYTSATGSYANAKYIPLASALIAMPSLTNRKSYTMNETLTCIKEAVKNRNKN